MRYWCRHIPVIQRNINASVNRLTRKSPFELLYGSIPKFVDELFLKINPDADGYQNPEQLRMDACNHIVAVQMEATTRFDKKHCSGKNLEIGQIVYARKPSSSTGQSLKLQP